MHRGNRCFLHSSCLTACGLLLSLALGCGQEQPPPSEKRSGAVVSASATDIPIYDPQKSSKPIDPRAFGPAIEQLMKSFDPAPLIEAYKEEHGNYPKDYAEFKSGVIEPNDLKFPDKLPQGLQVQYDEENHRVVVVMPNRK